MTVCSFDLSSNTGWAVARPPYRLAPTPLERACSGQPAPPHDFGQQSIRNEHNLGRFFLAWEMFFRDMLTTHAPHVVAYEATFSNRNQQATRITMGLEAVLTRVCFARKVPYVLTFTNSQVKRRGTGNGNATKEEMISAARAVGWTVRTDNEADALWLLDLTLSQLTPEMLKGVGHVLDPASAADRGAEENRQIAVG